MKTSWTISGSVGSINVCVRAIYQLCQRDLKGEDQQACECRRLSATTPFSVYIYAEPERVWQIHSAIKQTIISHLKRRAFTCLVFMFLSVTQKTSSGRPRFTANKMLCPPASLFLFLLYVCLSAFVYLFISAFWALLSCLFIFVNIGLTSTSPDPSSEVGAGDSLENRPLN